MWKDAVGFEGLYQVSNKGRVKSLNYNHTKKEKILKPYSYLGYQQISLFKSSTKKLCLVHRLVYEAFVGKLPKFENKGIGHGNEMWEINHKYENPSNNCIENIELVTRTENCNYGTRLSRQIKTQSKKVFQYSTNIVYIKTFDSLSSCKKEGFDIGKISLCCNHKRKTHGGYIWSYEPQNEQHLL